jgi:hypothetical protein
VVVATLMMAIVLVGSQREQFLFPIGCMCHLPVSTLLNLITNLGLSRSAA